MGLSVLLVDDSTVARLAVKAILRDSDVSIVEASSGESALGLVEAGLEPGLVFLDLTMPGMGGIETLRALMSRLPSLKVAVVTADVQSRSIAEARAAGAFEVIRKPPEKAAVLDILARAGAKAP